MGSVLGHYAATMSSALKQFANDTERAIAAYFAAAEFHEQIMLMLIKLLTLHYRVR